MIKRPFFRFLAQVPSHDSAVSRHIASALTDDANSSRDISARDVSARDESTPEAVAGLCVLDVEQERELAGRGAYLVREGPTHVRQGAHELWARVDVAGEDTSTVKLDLIFHVIIRITTENIEALTMKPRSQCEI